MEKRNLSRKTFLKGSGAALATLGLTSCAARTSGSANKEELADTSDAPKEEGEWKAATCWSHCGGRCSLKALVKDGVITRLKTDDTHEDSPDWPQRRACLRGRSRRDDIYSPDRLKYPMKRKNWQPGGEGFNGELRGKDEWERISWDEALDLVASEVSRIREKYGNRSIYGHRSIVIQGSDINDMSLAGTEAAWHLDEFGSMFMRGMDFGIALSASGGFTTSWTTASQGAFAFCHLYGYGSSSGQDFMNDRFDCRNVETAILIGVNPAYSADSTSFWSNWLPVHDAGCRFITIDPMYTDSAAILGAEWVPIRPNTDVALLMAMCYVMISEDDPEANPLIDWDVIERCTIGFDENHMPEGEDARDNFRDHILGTYDNQPKDPKWASDITGIPEDKIVELGRLMGKQNKVALLTGWGPARNHNGETFTQAFMCAGILGGHFGQSGHMTAGAIEDAGFNGGDFLITPGDRGVQYPANGVDDILCGPTMWRDMLRGRYRYVGDGGSVNFVPGEERDIDIECLYLYASDPLHSYEDASSAIEVLRKVEFVVSHATCFNDTARYSDIVLPVVTAWEKSPEFLMFTNPNAGYLKDQVIEPCYEAKSERWIGRELCNRWGLDGDALFPEDDLTLSWNQISSVNIATAPGEYTPLCSFTEEEAAEFGNAGQARTEGLISYSEFKEKGVYCVPRNPEDGYGHIAYEEFRANPEDNPMRSESGKFEFYCRGIRDLSAQVGLGEVPPVPTYIPSPGGYEEARLLTREGDNSTMAFQVYNPHYLRSSHYYFDNLESTREAFSRPLYINSVDANAIGISEGDTVCVSNDNGTMLRHACVTGRIAQGVVALPHGGSFDFDESDQLSLGGCDNVLTSPTSCGLGTSGYNSQACRVEKYTGNPIPADTEMMPEAPQCQND